MLDGLSQLTNTDDFSLFELPPTVPSGSSSTSAGAMGPLQGSLTQSGTDPSSGAGGSLPSGISYFCKQLPLVPHTLEASLNQNS